eukprot:scaffold48_cov161-Amphora_coffeaeformis.AAC.20
MQLFGIFTLLLALLLAPLASARLSLLRLSHGDQKLRGLATRQEPSTYETHLAFRELISFWGELSTSMSTPPPLPPTRPSPVDVPGLDWDFFSMSMSMPETPAAGSDMSMSMPASITFGGTTYNPTTVDDVSGSTETTVTDGDESVASGGDVDTDSAATDNLDKDANALSSSGASTPQTVLFIVLVGAAMAVMSAWYVRKNQRASSNASQMTPASSPLL